MSPNAWFDRVRLFAYSAAPSLSAGEPRVIPPPFEAEWCWCAFPATRRIQSLARRRQLSEINDAQNGDGERKEMEQEIVLTRKSGSGRPLLSPRRRWSLSMSGFLTLVFIIFAPMPGFAQSSIAGVVTDASNAVLPGVTVEASSPALIEKVRTVTTDENGRFQVVDLRPGVYNITFTLAVFKSVVREGLSLTATITATVNAQMSVGGLEETITVTGESPVVDVQRTAAGTTF